MTEYEYDPDAPPPSAAEHTVLGVPLYHSETGEPAAFVIVVVQLHDGTEISFTSYANDAEVMALDILRAAAAARLDVAHVLTEHHR